MRSALRTILLCALCVAMASFAGMSQQTNRTGERGEMRLPNGRLQRDMILKADYEKNLEDAARLSKLADELKLDLEKDTQYVFSIDNVKKLEEIEKLAKRIRSRMKRL